jgi:hypothetical protein
MGFECNVFDRLDQFILSAVLQSETGKKPPCRRLLFDNDICNASYKVAIGDTETCKGWLHLSVYYHRVCIYIYIYIAETGRFFKTIYMLEYR